MYGLKNWKCHASEPAWQISHKNSIIRSSSFTQNSIMVMSSSKTGAYPYIIWESRQNAGKFGWNG